MRVIRQSTGYIKYKLQLIKLLVHFEMQRVLIITVFCLAGVGLSVAREEKTEENEKLSLHERMERMEREIGAVRTENLELQEKIENLRNPPFGYFCSYKESFSAANSVITYDKLLYSSQFGLQGDSPGIDINTGKFVAGFSGTWRVEFSLYTGPDPGEDIVIFLFKNEELIPETLFHSYRSSSVSGYDYNTGGRSVLLHLDLGDELHLATTSMGNTAYKIIFCVSLEQFDV